MTKITLAAITIIGLAFVSGFAQDKATKSTELERKYTVWAFKHDGSQWVKQEERTLVTTDLNKALSYIASVNRVAGWRASSNVPRLLPILNAKDPIVALQEARRIMPGTWKHPDGPRIALTLRPDLTASIDRADLGRQRVKWAVKGDRFALFSEDGEDAGFLWEFQIKEDRLVHLDPLDPKEPLGEYFWQEGSK